MKIERITGAPGSGKTTKLMAIGEKLVTEGVAYLHMYARHNSTASKIMKEIERSGEKVVLIDECSEKLLQEIEATGADLRIYAVVQS